MKRIIGTWTATIQDCLTTAQRLALAILCGLLLTSGALAQEQQPEPPSMPEQSTPEAAATQKVPNPNEALTPVPLANQTVDGDIVFTSPGQFTYPRDIRLSDNFGGLRFFGADQLTTSPAGAAIQFFGNNASPYPGQLYLDSGAHTSAALIFRTAPTDGTITERMRITASGRVGIGTTTPANAMLIVSNNNNPNAVIGVSGNAGSTGVLGQGDGRGVRGYSPNGFGVLGESGNVGVYGYSAGGTGVIGETTNGFAGSFFGNVQVNGRLTKSSGSFKIDHPLDPANKYLSHSFVESPDMMNIYNGNVVLDRRGRATVTLPDWFEALNREFRYQLTAVGAPGPNLYVLSEIKGNTFKIAGGRAGMKVSWMVTGVRRDAYAEKHRIPVEEDKPDAERGTYLNPEAFGQSEEKSGGRAHRLDEARQLEQRRTEAERARQLRQ